MIDGSLLQKIDFAKQGGLIPAIVQDAENGQVLMLAYMSAESLKITLEKKLACYYSRSRKELWLKGETSGHYQHVKEIALDCDEDTLLLKVIQDGAACHTGARSCFYRTLYKEEEPGMVTYDQDKCMGCQTCSAACPYDVPRYEDRGGKTVINKCSGCVDRIAQGMMPACVTTCQPGALQFGTREEMIALANERLQLLRDRGYEDACIYGENEMEGLHVIQVLKHGTKPHGAVENPQIPPAAFLSGIMKPVTAVGAGATVLGLAAMFGLAAGYKRDTLVYNDGNGDTISLETGEVTKQGNGPDERTVMEAITENLPIGKKGGDDHE